MSQVSVTAPESLNLTGVSAKWAFGFAAAVTVVVFCFGLASPGFAVNSWTHLELSKGIFTDFYRLNTLRNFDTPVPYSQAFPPLWSTIIAIFRRVLDLGVYTGYLLNLPVCLWLLAVLMRFFRQIDLPEWAGAACYLSLLGFAPFRVEALGSRTIPLDLALLCSALVLLFSDRLDAPRAALAGLLTGLACLTRFDAFAPACAIGAAFAVRTWWTQRRLGRAVTVAALYFLILGVTLSPMIGYGMKHFGKLFPSDNTRMVFQAKLGGVMDYYKTPPPKDLFQHPGKWVNGLLFHKAPKIALLGLFILHSENESGLLLLAAIVLVVWGGGRPPILSEKALQLILFVLLMIPVMLAPSILGGIVDSRYFAGPVLLLFIALFVLLASLIPGAWSSRRTAFLLLAAATPLYSMLFKVVFLFPIGPGFVQKTFAPLSPTPQMQRLTEAIHRDSGAEPHRVILTDSSTAAAKYGALTGEPVTLVPDIMSGTFADFARDWHITHVYDGSIERAVWELDQVTHPDLIRKIRASGVELFPLDLPGLYRIRLGAERPH